MNSKLNCFKAYDIRGIIGVEIDEHRAYQIGKAIAQHFYAKNIVIGFDARETSPKYAVACANGAMAAGSNVLDIGMAGTEEMYWAVNCYEACAGIEVTASHNPINYNGMKIVKEHSRPLDPKKDFNAIQNIVASEAWNKSSSIGKYKNIAVEARQKYVKRILRFVDLSKMKSKKIVINSGNGAAGPTLDILLNQLKKSNVSLEFVLLNHKPDSSFPNGIPNPLLEENRASTSTVVCQEKADMGVAFDGDFDRCFIFDEKGNFLPGEYVVGLLSGIFLEKEAGSKIVHDPRIIWNTQDIIQSKGGKAVVSKTGHAFVKQTMRDHNAIYGGEMSAHHYFRDFAYSDSGMVPWLLIVELLCGSNKSLGELVKERYKAFPSSGEINFYVNDTEVEIRKIFNAYKADAVSIDQTDGISLEFDTWRFNLRKSNTEPLLRLNVESRGHPEKLAERVATISNFINNTDA